MLKKTITYEDFDGNKYTEDFYFNINQIELEELQISVDGGMYALLESLIPEELRNNPDAEDVVIKIDQKARDLWNLFKIIVDKSYGVKSEDGKRFRKNEQILNDFKESNAYVELIVELATNNESAEAFINGIFSSIKNA